MNKWDIGGLEGFKEYGGIEGLRGYGWKSPEIFIRNRYSNQKSDVFSDVFRIFCPNRKLIKFLVTLIPFLKNQVYFKKNLKGLTLRGNSICGI